MAVMAGPRHVTLCEPLPAKWRAVWTDFTQSTTATGATSSLSSRDHRRLRTLAAASASYTRAHLQGMSTLNQSQGEIRMSGGPAGDRGCSVQHRGLVLERAAAARFDLGHPVGQSLKEAPHGGLDLRLGAPAGVGGDLRP